MLYVMRFTADKSIKIECRIIFLEFTIICVIIYLLEVRTCLTVASEYVFTIFKAGLIMISSMTGFGKGANETDNGIYAVEIKSVNNRYIDISVKAPREFIAFEDKIKRIVQNRLKRGKIDVFIGFRSMGDGGRRVSFDESLANAYFDAMRSASEKCNVNFAGTASDLFKMPDVFTVERVQRCEGDIWSELRPAVENAVEAIAVMRLTEGETLKNVLIMLVNGIESRFCDVEAKAPSVPLNYAAKLKERVSELMGSENVADPQRIASEIALFADRCNIDEEIARFKSHISQFKAMLDTDEPIGRKLDFLVQELNREINTVGSKANDTDITGYVIEIKSEIEKIREQIQNIE